MKIERKLMVIGLSCLFVSIAVGSAFAVTRTIQSNKETISGGTYFYSGNYDWISGSHFNLSSKITNSFGHVWNVSEANLLLAIADLGTTGGTITVGSDVTLTSAITTIRNYTTIDFQGNVVTIGDHGFINLSLGCQYNTIKNVVIHVSDKSYDPDVISLSIGAHATDALGWTHRIYMNTFENIRISPTGSGVGSAGKCYNYTGIKIDIATSAGASSMWGNTFRDFTITYPRKGINIDNRDNANWFNGNTFENFMIDEFLQAITINSSGGGATGNNIFSDIKGQSSVKSRYFAYLSSGDSNMFTDCVVHDWPTPVGSGTAVYAWYIGSSVVRTTIDTNYLLKPTYIYDAGDGTTIESTDIGHIYDVAPYAYIIFKDAQGLTCLQNGSTGGIIYKNYDPQNVFYYAANIATRADPTYETDKAPNTAIFIRSGTYNINAYLGSGNAHDMTWIGEDKHTTILKANATLTSGMFATNGEHNVTFRNLCFDGGGYAGMAIYIAFDASTNGTTVDGCIFKNWNGSSTSYGVYSAATSTDIIENVKIRNCEFRFCRYAVRLVGDADPSIVSGCDISHNYITGCKQGIYLEHGQNCTISNNIIRNGTTGIYLPDTHNCTITGNVISATNGIAEGDAANDNIIMGNNLRQCTTPTIRIGVTTIITGNIPIGTTGFQLPTSAPTTAVAGSMYVNATTGDIAVYSGSAWIWTHG